MCDLDHKVRATERLKSQARGIDVGNPIMRTLILSSAFAITFCWAVAVLLVRRWLMPKVSREPEIEMVDA
jgi:hypothetical protein